MKIQIYKKMKNLNRYIDLILTLRKFRISSIKFQYNLLIKYIIKLLIENKIRINELIL